MQAVWLTAPVRLSVLMGVPLAGGMTCAVLALGRTNRLEVGIQIID